MSMDLLSQTMETKIEKKNRLVFRGILNITSIPQWADLRLTLPCSVAFFREYIGTILYTNID